MKCCYTWGNIDSVCDSIVYERKVITWGNDWEPVCNRHLHEILLINKESKQLGYKPLYEVRKIWQATNDK